MEDNNTSAFNCRDIPGTNEPTQHAYGRAIDLNPLLNPSVDSSGAFEPKNASTSTSSCPDARSPKTA
jgi:hypothetical protein